MIVAVTPAIISGYLIFTPHAATTSVADFDNDGFSNELEIYLGTDPLKKCSQMGLPYPNMTNLSWPADTKFDYKIDKQDAEVFTPYFGKRTDDSGFNVRYDLNKDGLINVRDVLTLNRFMGQSCAPDPEPFSKPGAPLLGAGQTCANETVTANLSWSIDYQHPVPNSAADGYKIYQWNEPASGTWNLIKDVQSKDARNFDYGPLVMGKGYTLQITAYNSAGESDPSTNVGFTALSCGPNEAKVISPPAWSFSL